MGEPLAQRERALGALHALLAIGGPIALLIASVVGYILAAAALRPVERMRRHAAAVTAAGTSERLPVPPDQRRDRPAGAHAERDAGPVGGRLQARAGVRLGCLARAAHAAGDPADRARARAARQAHPGGARGRAALGRRGVRAAVEPGRGPAGDRALGPGTAAGAPGGAGRGRRARARRRALPDARQGRGAADHGRAFGGRAAQRRPRPDRAGARQPGRQRAHLRRRGRWCSAPGPRTAASSCTCSTRAPASRPSSCRAPSSASPAPTRRVRGAAPVSGSRSRPRWPERTAARPTRRTSRAARTCGSRCLHDEPLMRTLS